MTSRVCAKNHGHHTTPFDNYSCAGGAVTFENPEVNFGELSSIQGVSVDTLHPERTMDDFVSIMAVTAVIHNKVVNI